MKSIEFFLLIIVQFLSDPPEAVIYDCRDVGVGLLKLGKADSENIRSRSPDLFEMQGNMRTISFTEDAQVIREILTHLGLWLVRSWPPPKVHDPPVCMLSTGGPIDPAVMDDVSQLPINDDHLYRDPQYTWDDYIQA
ncbi:MAG: hypothetical protein JXC33_07615 [Deltaproteobacteria bacterium]|nr:hypothetical protein [Deltaproteobacteria bacterium]MBN2687053.1 hypothetical protein [Deltaproteobacteria bacterium]